MPRERNVDVKRSRELQGFLDAIRRGQEQVLGDLSMTLCDPYAINFLSGSAMKLINHQGLEFLPRLPKKHISLIFTSVWKKIFEKHGFKWIKIILTIIFCSVILTQNF